MLAQGQPPLVPGAAASELNQETCAGGWVQLFCHDPETVCAPVSLLVCALRSVGVELHPAFGFQSFQTEKGKFWRWVLAPKSSDDLYDTPQLIAWWDDEAWLAAHRTHEWAIARSVLMNMAMQAREIRDMPVLAVVISGQREAHIPVSFSDAQRAFVIDQLEGRVPMSAVFTESEPAAS